jgi:hypothetical protein
MVGLAAVAMAACLIGAGPARATDFVTLDWYSCSPTEAVNAYVNNSYVGSWYCGQYDLQVEHSPGSFGGLGVTLVGQAQQNLPPYTMGSYCIDVHQDAPTSYGVYTIYPLAYAPIASNLTGIAMGSTKANDLERLFSLLPSNLTNQTAGAFQAAVWEIVNETSTNLDGSYHYDVTSGSFMMTEYNIGNGTGWLGQANTWLNELHAPGTVPVADVVALVNPDTQDYALTVLGAGSSRLIPEPITMAGLMMGIGGLVGYVRRRARK